MIYLASPYSANPDVFYAQTVQAMTKLMGEGHRLFSPILHCRPMETDGGLPGDFEFWQGYNQHMISKADAMWVLGVDGWRESKGVRAEIEIAKFLGIPVYLLSPELRLEGSL